MKYKRSPLTMEQEKEIRRAFFIDHMKPAAICQKWGITRTRLTVLVGGPLRTGYGVECVYN